MKRHELNGPNPKKKIILYAYKKIVSKKNHINTYTHADKIERVKRNYKIIVNQWKYSDVGLVKK